MFGVLLLAKLTGVWRIHLKSVPSSWKIYPYRKTQEKTAPFSFWKNIYLNPILHREDEYDKVFKHEQVHVSQLHSLDVLIAETALLLFWYNPICWLTGQAVRENIEFITDQKVLSSGTDKQGYQFSLLHIAISSTQPVLGNHFNIKNLKKRIIMMNKKQTSKMHFGKYVFILSAVVFGSLIFGVSKAYESSNNNETSPIQKEIERTAIIDKDTLPTEANPLILVDGIVLPYESPNKLAPNKLHPSTY
ncbi:MAG: M56 family metallopeptidase [Anditalea sp.]